MTEYLDTIDKFFEKSDEMQNKTITIFLAIISIISLTSCSKKPKLDSDIDISSVDEVSSEDTSSDLAIGERIMFDEKELTEDLNYKILNIMNERNYFNDSDELMYEIGEYFYRAYQDSKFTNYVYVIVNPDDEEPQIYDFIQSEGILKYVGHSRKDYFDVVIFEKIAEGRFTYEEVFEPTYGDNGIDYEVIAQYLKDNYSDEEYIDGTQGSVIYFRNQFSWDISRGSGTFSTIRESYVNADIDVLLIADSGNIYDTEISSRKLNDALAIIEPKFQKWHLGMMRHSLQEFGFTEAHQRMVDRIIETSPYNFELAIWALY